MSQQTTFSRAQFEDAREMAYGDITSSFTQIGTPFTSSFSVVFVQNFTNQIIDFCISYSDTVSLRFSLAPGGSLCTDMISNSVQIAAGESVWCKYRTSAPTIGFVQVAAITPV